MKKKILFLIVFLSGFFAKGQNIKGIVVDESANGKIFSLFLLELEERHNVDFIFNEKKLEALTVNGISDRTRIMDYLKDYLIQYRVIIVADNIAFIVDKDLGEELGRREENYIVFGNNDTEIKGRVMDGSTGDPIVGSQVFIPERNKGVLTNTNGYFQFQVYPGLYRMDIKYIGYETTSYIIGFSRFGDIESIQAVIFPESRELETVMITAERFDRNVTSQLTGVENLNIETVKRLPAFLGEVDPIRSLTTLPGVSTVGELSSGFNVRGGETGQNLILQDGATIYNPSHLFGFFSAFNPDMISDVVLYKGGGPANFGSRVSSVLDVKLRNGNAGKHTVNGGVGLVSSRLSVEGPIVKNKTSYLLGGRISYSNWLLKATDNIQLLNSSARFYDITAKVFHTINENNLISFSGYRSYDDFRLATDSTFSWVTFNGAVNWDHSFNDRFSSSLNVSSSNYESEIYNDDVINGFSYANGIENISLKYNLIFNPNDENTLQMGAESKGIWLEPGELAPLKRGSNILSEDISDQRALESAFYIQGDVKVSKPLAISIGLRYSNFIRMGKDNIYTYDYSNIIGRYPAIVDTIRYSSGEVITNYSGLEPRLSIRYLLKENASVKVSYYRVYQYMHLVSNTTSVTPQDYWITSGPDLKPQVANQFSLGYFKNFKNNLYELSLEGFYKEISNTVDYIEGADLTLNHTLEAGLAQGKGLAYGVELFLKKNSGLLDGWLSYTFSRSWRKFDAAEGIKTINEGKYYPASYDQPHHFSLILNYRLGTRSTLSANFNYSTGRPITIPVSKFSYDAYLAVLNYSERNEYRIPDYHRLDLSLTIKNNPNKRKRFEGEWTFSVFNVYSRNNAYSIFFNRYGRASKLSILGSIFPSVSYNFSF